MLSSEDISLNILPSQVLKNFEVFLFQKKNLNRMNLAGRGITQMSLFYYKIKSPKFSPPPYI